MKRSKTTGAEDAGLADPPSAKKGAGAPAAPARSNTVDDGNDRVKARKSPKGRKPARQFEKPESLGEYAPAADAKDLASKLPARDRESDGLFRVSCWNVASLRSLQSKSADVLRTYVEKEDPDVLILLETKLRTELCRKEPMVPSTLFGAASRLRYSQWTCSTTKKGYAGVAMFSAQKPQSVQLGLGKEKHDGEGRVITAEFDEATVVGVYTPNSGQGLKRLEYRTKEWDPDFLAHINGLRSAGKPVVVTGDLNVAHRDIDIHAPAPNCNKSAGFHDDERANFDRILEAGWVDRWAQQHPTTAQYTFWGFRFNLRSKNKGWRLDYSLVDEQHQARIAGTHVRHQMCKCSDHVPVVIDLQRASMPADAAAGGGGEQQQDS